MKLIPDSLLLQLTDPITQQKITIPLKTIVLLHKTLGHWKAPSGLGSHQLLVLTSKGCKLAFQLINSPTTSKQAYLFYTAIYCPSISYVLPQCCFTPAQLHQVQAKLLPLILAKCGFLCTTAYNIMFAPYRLCNGGYVSCETFQDEGKIMLFVKHWQTPDKTCSLLWVALVWTQF